MEPAPLKDGFFGKPDGVISSTAWVTWFSKLVTAIGAANSSNGVVLSVGATSPLLSSGGTTPVISAPAANSANAGYLQSSDWSTFNSKVTSVSANGLLTATSGTTPEISSNMATGKLVGRGSANAGIFEEVTLGTGLSLTGTTLNSTVTAPGGLDTYVQFNEGGAFGGVAEFTFEPETNTLALTSGGFTFVSFTNGGYGKLTSRLGYGADANRLFQVYHQANDAAATNTCASSSYLYLTRVADSSTSYGHKVYVQCAASAGGGYEVYGCHFQVNAQYTGVISPALSAHYGVIGTVYAGSSTYQPSGIVGLAGEATVSGAGSMASGSAIGCKSTVTLQAAATVNSLFGYSATVTKSAGTLTTAYGYYVADVACAGATNYSFYGGKGLVHFGDAMSVTGWQDVVQTTIKAHSSQTANLVEFQSSAGAVQLAIAGNGRDFVLDTATGSKIGTAATQKLGFWNASPVVQDTGWAVTAGYTADRAFDPESTSLTEVARTLGTLIDTLKSYGILGA